MSKSSIEWTTETWNPTTGCTKVSSGCANCYAEVMARRLHAMGVKGYENVFKISLHPNRLSQPLKKKKPTIYFVNSMSDVFHPKVPFKFIDEMLNVIHKTPQHTYQILTKRPTTMLPIWAENIQKSCQKQQVPFFFKQWGAWGSDGIKRSKKENGRFLNNKVWEEYPQ